MGLLPGWADSSLSKTISSSFTISFHISLSPSGEKARYNTEEIGYYIGDIHLLYFKERRLNIQLKI